MIIKPIATAHVKNPNNLSQRDMIKYTIDNKETIDLHVESTRKKAEKILKESIPSWLPHTYAVSHYGSKFDSQNNLIYEFYVEDEND